MSAVAVPSAPMREANYSMIPCERLICPASGRAGAVVRIMTLGPRDVQQAFFIVATKRYRVRARNKSPAVRDRVVRPHRVRPGLHRRPKPAASLLLGKLQGFACRRQSFRTNPPRRRRPPTYPARPALTPAEPLGAGPVRPPSADCAARPAGRSPAARPDSSGRPGCQVGPARHSKRRQCFVEPALLR